MIATIQFGSVEMLQVPGITHNGVAVANNPAVAFAFGPLGQPMPANPIWYTADWYAPGIAQLLIGGTAVPLVRGEYLVYLKITADPEIPAVLSGRLSVR